MSRQGAHFLNELAPASRSCASAVVIGPMQNKAATINFDLIISDHSFE
jgi:hypothetical protein